MSKWVVGIDLGGTKIALGLVSPENEVVTLKRIPTNADDGPEVVIERIAEQIDVLKGALPPSETIAGVGICTPGPVNHVTGELLTLVNLPGISNTPLRALLEKRLGIPVRLDHDAKVAALGEFHYGVGRGAGSMVYIVFGTGVGGAIIIDGDLYYGVSNSSGEVGHMTVNPDGVQCQCGSRGCLETYTSGPWIERHYQIHTGNTVDGHQITELARSGDAIAGEVMQQAGRAIGIAVASMAMMLNIELYVLGGSVANAGDLLIKPAMETVPQYSFKAVGERVKIATSELGDNAPILGGAQIIRQILF